MVQKTYVFGGISAWGSPVNSYANRIKTHDQRPIPVLSSLLKNKNHYDTTGTGISHVVTKK